MRRWLTTLALLSALACQRIERSTIDAPPGLMLVMIVESSDGSTLTGGELEDGDHPSAPPSITTSADQRVYLLGYRPSELGSACGRPLAMSEIAGSQVLSAERCDPKLPPPAWATRLDAPTATQTAPRAALTAAFMRSCCPDGVSSATLAIGLSCGPGGGEHHCSGRATWRGCRASIDLSACEPGLAVDLVVGPDRSACLVAGPGAQRCADAATPTHLDTALACEVPECRIALALSPLEPRFSLAVAALDDVPPVTPDTDEIPTEVGNAQRFGGYADDLALVGGRLLVFTHPALLPIDSSICQAEERGLTQIRVLDPESLAGIGTRTATPCLTRLLADPGGASVVAAGAPAPPLGSPRFPILFERLDPEGRVLASSSTTVPWTDPRPQSRAGLSLLALAETKSASGDRRIVALVGAQALDINIPGLMLHDRLLVLDARSLAVLKQLDLAHGLAAPSVDARAMAVIGTEVVVAENYDDSARWIDLDTGTADPIKIAPNIDPSAVLALPPTGIVITSAGGHPGLFFTQDRGANGFQRAELLEHQGWPLALEVWPAVPGWVLVGYSIPAGHGFEATLALYDPAAQRVLPGSQGVGPGIISRMVGDGRRIFGLLPWSAKVVRVTPR